MESRDLAFVSDRSGPFYLGGYERHLWDLARALAKDHRVTVYTSLPVKRLRREGVDFVRISPFWSYTRAVGGHGAGSAVVLAASQSAYLPASRHHDFVDLQGIPYAQIPGLRGRLALGRDRWGVTVWEAWFDYPEGSGLRTRLARVAIRNLIRFATAGTHPVLVGATRTRVALTRRFRVAGERIRVVPPSIDHEAIAHQDPARVSADIVMLSRLEPYKRVEDGVRALDLLRARGLRPTLHVLGEGSDHPRLERLTNQLGLRDQVTFWGSVDDAQKYGILKAGRTFVLPSEREGFSIATLEAMGCGRTPIVARPANPELFGVGDLIENGINGATYPVGDLGALTDRLERCLGDSSELARRSAAALTTARGYTVERTTREWLAATESAGPVAAEGPGLRETVGA
ncbi:MAG: glycosyltransferase [Thermoplasmata archaeon]|nr:glycosyltransferase [Thermoplasmata archaeon]